jgi:hypothetical protein
MQEHRISFFFTAEHRLRGPVSHPGIRWPLATRGGTATREAGGFCGGQLVGAVVGAPSQQADDPVQKLLVEAGVRWPAAAESCEILK